MMSAYNSFNRESLITLSAKEEAGQHLKHARNEVLTDASVERKMLLEDCVSGYITKAELRDELLLLKERENEKHSS